MTQSDQSDSAVQDIRDMLFNMRDEARQRKLQDDDTLVWVIVVLWSVMLYLVGRGGRS